MKLFVFCYDMRKSERSEMNSLEPSQGNNFWGGQSFILLSDQMLKQTMELGNKMTSQPRAVPLGQESIW